MIAAALLVTATSILLSVAARVAGRRVRPSTFAVVFTCASVANAVASTGLFAIVAWYGAARIPPIASSGGWSSTLLNQTAPVPRAFSAVAVVVVAVIAGAVGQLWLQRGRELRSAQQQWSRHKPDEIAIAPADDIDAFAIDGTRSTQRIVLTAGLLRELSDPELQTAVIAHERAHLRHHHLLYRMAVATAATANPLLLPVRRSVNDALEAWADDDAVAATGHATVATAIATVALARRHRQDRVVLQIAPGPAQHRIERLLRPQAPSRVAVGIGAALALCALVVLAASCRQTESFFELLRVASR